MKKIQDVKKKFIEECKKKFESSNIKKEDITKMTGLSSSTVDDFFKGKSDFKISTALKILNVLKAKILIK